MQYLRDCNNTEDFEKHFLKPFVRNQINDYRRLLLSEFEKEFGCENEEFNFIMNFKSTLMEL